MDQQTVRKTFKYKFKPTPQQERILNRTLMLCRHVYNAAIGERREAWQKCGVSVGYYQQKAELPGIKAELPEYAEVNAQVLQDVVQRVDRAFRGATATTASPIRRWASMAGWRWTAVSSAYRRLDVSPSGCTARWKERRRRSRSAVRWMVGTPVSPVRMYRYSPGLRQDRKLA